jgi:hypothetical protein
MEVSGEDFVLDLGLGSLKKLSGTSTPLPPPPEDQEEGADFRVR